MSFRKKIVPWFVAACAAGHCIRMAENMQKPETCVSTSPRSDSAEWKHSTRMEASLHVFKLVATVGTVAASLTTSKQQQQCGGKQRQ